MEHFNEYGKIHETPWTADNDKQQEPDHNSTPHDA
jgi:hypothetical protein